MLAGPIYFSSSQNTFFKKMIALCKKQYGQIKVRTSYPSANELELANQPLSALCTQLDEQLSEFIHLSPKDNQNRHDAMLVAVSLGYLRISGASSLPSTAELTHDFYARLLNRFMTCATLTSAIVNTLQEQRDRLIARDEKNYHEVAGYFLLLSAILTYNNLVYREHHGHYDNFEKILPTLKVWTQQFELNYFEKFDIFSLELRQLRNLYFSRYNQFQREIIHRHGKTRLTLTEYQTVIAQKNNNASQFSRPYSAEIIYSSAGTRALYPEPTAVETLLSKIQIMTEQGTVQRQQFIFHYNNEFGHVECIDVSYDPTKNQLTIINVNSANGGQQHYFLNALTTKLLTSSIPFSLYACQAYVQRDEHSCGIYAYAISGELAKRSLEDIIQPRFFCEQPTFGDCDHLEAIEYPLLPSVQWLSVEALGDKVILMGQSFTAMEAILARKYSAEKAKEMITDFMLEHGLKKGSPEEKRTYPSVLVERLKRRVTLEFTPAALQAKLNNAINLPQALRRAAANPDTQEEFLWLTHALPSDGPDPKGYTPLHHTVSRGLVYQTARLLRLGANPDTPHHDETKAAKSAKEIYQTLRDDSPIKNHSYIKSRLS